MRAKGRTHRYAVIRSDGRPRVLCGGALTAAALMAACGSSAGTSAGGHPDPSAVSSALSAVASSATASQSAGAAAGISVDACKVLDADTAQTAIGTPVTPARQSDGGAKCSYDAADGSGANVALAVHSVRRASLDDLYARNATPVDGLGDKAFWNEALATLVVYKGQGDVVVQVVLAGGPSPESADRARVIAQKALSA